MNCNALFSNIKELKIRLHWLLSASIVFFVSPLMLFVDSFIKALYNKTEIKDFSILYLAIFGLVMISVFYYFGLKKQGTKLFSIFLSITPVLLFNNLLISVDAKPIDFQTSVILFGIIVMILWWWIASYRLREVNLKHVANLRLLASQKSIVLSASKCENTIRYRWLISINTFLFIFPTTLLLVGLVLMRFDATEIAYISSLIAIAIGIVPFGLLYYFAYKKRGTKVLRAWLILAPLIIMSRTVKSMGQDSMNIWLFVIHAMVVILFAWWWLQSYRLLRVNQK